MKQKLQSVLKVPPLSSVIRRQGLASHRARGTLSARRRENHNDGIVDPPDRPERKGRGRYPIHTHESECHFFLMIMICTGDDKDNERGNNFLQRRRSAGQGVSGWLKYDVGIGACGMWDVQGCELFEGRKRANGVGSGTTSRQRRITRNCPARVSEGIDMSFGRFRLSSPPSPPIGQRNHGTSAQIRVRSVIPQQCNAML